MNEELNHDSNDDTIGWSKDVINSNAPNIGWIGENSHALNDKNNNNLIMPIPFGTNDKDLAGNENAILNTSSVNVLILSKLCIEAEESKNVIKNSEINKDGNNEISSTTTFTSHLIINNEKNIFTIIENKDSEASLETFHVVEKEKEVEHREETNESSTFSETIPIKISIPDVIVSSPQDAKLEPTNSVNDSKELNSIGDIFVSSQQEENKNSTVTNDQTKQAELKDSNDKINEFEANNNPIATLLPSTIIKEAEKEEKTSNVENPIATQEIASVGTENIIPSKFIKEQFNIEENVLGSNNGLGKIKISAKYEHDKSKLLITIHEASNLINTDKNSFSDPYCRIYLLPDEKQATKQKTKVIKNNLNPKWEETFFYVMTLAESISKTLYLNLKDQKGFFEKQETQFLGELHVKLTPENLKGGINELWYYLESNKNNKKK